MSPDDQRRVLATLTPMAVRHYAQSRGWISVEGVRGRIWLLRHQAHPLRQLVIPMDADDPGFVDAMADVLQRLAELEGRVLEVVLSDLQTPDADVLRVRVVHRDSDAGQLSLTSDVMLRDGARRALLAAACSVIHPVTYHPRMTRSEAESLLAACRAGQTEFGSYVIKVICPLYAVPETLDLYEPFTRRVVRHLMKTTAELVDSIEQTSIETYIDAQKERPRLSANLCEALLRMQTRDDEQPRERDAGHLELLTAWASDPHVPPPTPTQVPSRVVIKAEYLPEIERAASLLRPAAMRTREELFIGTVETLDGTVGADGRRSGDVTFSLLLRDSESIRARATLSSEDYDVALQAHQGGIAYVRLNGVLRRGPRINRITSLRSLELLESAD